METRIDELEAKLSLTEDLLDTLNMTVFRQQTQIEALQREMHALRLQLQSAGPGERGGSLRDEIPPHY